MVELLPRPVSHYKQVYGMKIANLCVSGLSIFFIPFLICLKDKVTSHLANRWNNLLD